MKKNLTIGVLGGMGTYATIHLFSQYAEVFPAEKEFDRPRIIIDNRCTMPSRVLAYLYGKNKEQLINEMTESMCNLRDAGCTRIILACNTSHLFLNEIYHKEPRLKDLVVNIIDSCVREIVAKELSQVFLLGSEGTIDSGIYQEYLKAKGINCIVPETGEYTKLRECIEAVKQNKYSQEVKTTFLDLINRYPSCTLGCTELPILFQRYKDEVICERVFDPLFLALSELREEYIND